MRVAALFSGGKDSTYAARVAQQRSWTVDPLVVLRPEDPESRLYHTPNLDLTRLQAEAMGLPLRETPAGEGEEAELEALRRALEPLHVDGVVVGAIASDYQHRRVNRVGQGLGLRVFAPLWRQDPRELVREYGRAGMRVVFSSVAAAGLDESWLGRPWDDAAVADLLRLQESHGVHPCGEGGEFETLVLDAPWFRKALEVQAAEPVWTGSSGVWRVTRARLVPKG